MEKEVVVEITTELDVVRCRKAARDMAVEIGFGIADQTRIVTVTSELARNIVQYAGSGNMTITTIVKGPASGIKLIFEDQGPGLNIDDAMTYGFSSGKGLGVGLPGSERLMDEFDLQSQKGRGTTITTIKWMKL